MVPAMPRVETILLATDLTGASSAATDQAIDLAVRLGARLLVVTVMEPAKGGVARRGVRPETREISARQAQAVVNEARAAGADSFLVWEGDAGDGIVAAAAARRTSSSSEPMVGARSGGSCWGRVGPRHPSRRLPGPRGAAADDDPPED